MRSSHVKLGAMSIVYLEINLFTTRRYMLVDNSHTLYIINHSILFLITIHTATYHTNTQYLHLSCPLPTVPQYSQIFHCFFFYFFSSSHTVSFYYFIFLHTTFKSLITPLHIKCIQRMRVQ